MQDRQSDGVNAVEVDQAMIIDRRSALEEEMTKGEARLRRLDQERAALRDQLLRIDGAITALAQLTSRELEQGSEPQLMNGDGRPSRHSQSSEVPGFAPEAE